MSKQDDFNYVEEYTEYWNDKIKRDLRSLSKFADKDEIPLADVAEELNNLLCYIEDLIEVCKRAKDTTKPYVPKNIKLYLENMK